VRIKSAPSALEKIARKAYRRSLDKVTDLIGVRVILLYPSQINTTVALLKREFNVIEYVDKRPGVDSEQFGYSSVHLVCNFLNTERAKLPEYSSFAGMAFEIQVRTILQEVWAEIEHRLVYKSEIEAPKEIKRLVHV
jgi:ppGpp synthetase/RelA/SpoT-type nucleotidyltranferase